MWHNRIIVRGHVKPVGLLIIGGGAFLLLATRKTALAASTQLTPAQQAALAAVRANQNQAGINSLLSGLGSFLKGMSGQQKSSGGSGSAGSGGSAPSPHNSNPGQGPVTCPNNFCPGAEDVQTVNCIIQNPCQGPHVCGNPFATPPGDVAPSGLPDCLGPCVTPCTTPCTTPCAGGGCFGDFNFCCA